MMRRRDVDDDVESRSPNQEAAQEVTKASTKKPVSGGGTGGKDGGGITAMLSSISLDRLLRICRGLNVANGVLLVVSCFFAFTLISGSVTRFFLAVYIGVFAALLLAFELRLKRTEGFIKTWFGFLYTYYGRTGFLMFLGAINFGMVASENDGTSGQTIVVLCGVITIANALFNCFVLCNHPAFRKAKEPVPQNDEEVLAYLDAHPEFALRAVQHVTSGGGSAASAKPKMLSPVDTDRELHSDDTAGQFEPRAASATVSDATTESSSHAARPPRAAPAPPTAAPPPRGPGSGVAPHDERGDAAVPSTGHRRAESAPVAPAQARHGRSHSPPPPPTTGSAVERPVYPATSRGPPPIPQRGAGAGGVRRPPPRPFAAPPADL